LVKSLKVEKGSASSVENIAIEWYDAVFNEALSKIETSFDQYRVSDALMTLYKHIWNDFCSNYLEMVKPTYGASISEEAYEQTLGFFDRLMHVLHPFMPFITEEIYILLKDRAEGASICISPYPTVQQQDKTDLIELGTQALDAVTAIRNIRTDKNLPAKELLTLQYTDQEVPFLNKFESVIKKLGGISEIVKVDTLDKLAGSFRIKTFELAIPLADKLDTGAEIAKLEKELAYQEGFLKSVEKKLSNERFVSNAPAAVIDKEKAKQDDATQKINSIKKQIENLK
jgi:valyl-tRNA synthetase